MGALASSPVLSVSSAAIDGLRIIVADATAPDLPVISASGVPSCVR